MKETRYNLEDPKLCSRLRSLVQNLGEVFSIEDEPAVGALCTIRGLVFEFLNPELDRLSPFFGIECSEGRAAFEIQVVESAEWGLGLMIARKNGQSFEARNAGLMHILNQESFLGSQLKRIIIYPFEVSSRLKLLGFKLVIVRDWILQTALQRAEINPLNYFVCNEWELCNVVASTQARLVANFELPFFGTHDIVDHLFGLDHLAFKASQTIAAKVLPTLYSLEKNKENAEAVELKMAYVAGVVLDDIAQSKCYHSRRHFEAIRLLSTALINKGSEMRKKFESIQEEKLEQWIGLTRSGSMI